MTDLIHPPADGDLRADIQQLEELSFFLRHSARQAEQLARGVDRMAGRFRNILWKRGISLAYPAPERRDPRDTHIEGKLLTLSDLQAELGISRGTLIKVRKCESFPKPVRVSGRRIAFLSKEVSDWIEGGGLMRNCAHQS